VNRVFKDHLVLKVFKVRPANKDRKVLRVLEAP
jgi:hypothetical protein